MVICLFLFLFLGFCIILHISLFRQGKRPAEDGKGKGGKGGKGGKKGKDGNEADDESEEGRIYMILSWEQNGRMACNVNDLLAKFSFSI